MIFLLSYVLKKLICHGSIHVSFHHSLAIHINMFERNRQIKDVYILVIHMLLLCVIYYS